MRLHFKTEKSRYKQKCITTFLFLILLLSLFFSSKKSPATLRPEGGPFVAAEDGYLVRPFRKPVVQTTVTGPFARMNVVCCPGPRRTRARQRSRLAAESTAAGDGRRGTIGGEGGIGGLRDVAIFNRCNPPPSSSKGGRRGSVVARRPGGEDCQPAVTSETRSWRHRRLRARLRQPSHGRTHTRHPFVT